MTVDCVPCVPSKSRTEAREETTKDKQLRVVQKDTHIDSKVESSTIVPATERSDITCESDRIVVFIPEAILPHAIGRNVTWRQDSCGLLNFNGTHYVGKVPLSACGTTVTIEEDNVTFTNEIIIHASVNDDDIIQGENDVTFGEDYETVIPVECIYPRESRISSNYIPIKQNIRFFEKRYGELDLHMQQYTSATYDKLVLPDQDAQRKIPLDSDVFMRIGFEFDTQELLIDAKKCIATSTPSPADLKWHALIEDSCPVNDVRLLSGKRSPDVKFAFRAFDFRQGSTGTVYIHCEVSVCGLNDVDCKAGCQPRNKRSAGDAPRKGSHLVSMGPFVMAHDDDTSRVSTSTLPTVFVVVSLLIALVAVVVAVIGWTRNTDRKYNPLS